MPDSKFKAAKGPDFLSRLRGVLDMPSLNFALPQGPQSPAKEMREMIRILSDPREDVDAALRDVESQRVQIIKEDERTDAVHQEQKRARLQPLLQAAGLQSTKGQTTAARSSYEDLLKRDPQWPQALNDFAIFLYYQSVQALNHGTLAAALADAEECLILAQRFYDLDAKQLSAQRIFANAHDQIGHVFDIRGKKGDSDAVFLHYTRSLEIKEALYKTNPNYPEAARDVCLSFVNLGDFYAKRGQPGDADNAFTNYNRCAEICDQIQQANPDSAREALIKSIQHLELQQNA